ncbi:MAG TPA: hypothetical protein ENH85_13200 [Candidatus Scalindua sp.]|nr:hypothetical protein [Candidatus Scalindua sp.]
MDKTTKFTFSFVDIAKIKRVEPQSVLNAARGGYFDPNDLSSLTLYIYRDMVRQMKQTLDFWKAKARKGVNDG